MLKNLIILGEGPHAHEMATIVARINDTKPTWRLLENPPSSPTDRNDYYVAFEHNYPDTPEIGHSRWASLIDPSCFVAPDAEIEPGCVLFPNCFVGHNARLEKRVFSLAGSVINHHDVIAPLVTLCSSVNIAGHVEIGPGTYLGQGCNIREFVKIGGGSLIGMGAVVLKDVEPNSVMVGTPGQTAALPE